MYEKTTRTAHWLLTAEQAPLAHGQIYWGELETSIDGVSVGDAPDITEGTTFLTPGLINAHTHLELYRSTPILPAPDEPLSEWLLRVIACRPLTEDDKREAAQKSAHECMAAGTTTVNDIASNDTSARVLDELGMRAIVSPEFFAPNPVPSESPHAIIEQVKHLLHLWAGHPTIQIGVSPHSPYNVVPATWRAVLQALPPATPVHAHLAESQAEWDYFMHGVSPLDTVHQRVLGRVFGPESSGISPTQAVARCLTPQTTVAHGVFCTPEDEALLISRHVGVAHCLRSNLLLNQHTITNLKARLESGMRIGLGTDSRLSCPDLDLRAEARAAQAHHGLTPQAVFELATLGGARALHLQENVGHLSIGYKADVVLWHHPDAPWEDPYAQWLSPQTQVVEVWIDGFNATQLMKTPPPFVSNM